jgi:hypothetical protein
VVGEPGTKGNAAVESCDLYKMKIYGNNSFRIKTRWRINASFLLPPPPRPGLTARQAVRLLSLAENNRSTAKLRLI